MAYYEQTYNTATPALDFMTSMQTWMPANGWVFVETVTSGTNVSDVYKSPGTLNSFGTDYYVSLNRSSTSATQVYYYLFEQWNGTSKLAIKYAPSGNFSEVAAADGSVNDSGVSIVLGASGRLYRSCYTSIGVSVSTTVYMNINVNRIISGNSLIPLSNIYVGLFDPFLTSHPFPIVSIGSGINHNSATLNSGAMTRETYGTTASTANWQTRCVSVSNDSVSLYPITYGITNSAVNPRTGLQNSFLIPFYGVKLGSAAAVGVLRDLVYNYSGIAYTLGGDTLAITTGGTTYNYVKPAMGSYLSPLWIPKQ